jgi:NADH-quinone oxidoreductase subunit L
MSVFLSTAWLIPLLPLLAALLITVTPIRRSQRASGWLAIGLMIGSTLLALGLLAAVAQGYSSIDGVVAAPHGAEHAAEHADAGHGDGFAFAEPALVQRFDWAPDGDGSLQMGLYVDGPVAAMLAMVTIAATAIHLFSLGYMAGHPRQSRFFSFISLFSAAMLLMTMADNLLLFFMAWEVMGLCSYLLIGFLYQRPTAGAASIKAFITTRIGDVLMLLGIVYLYAQAGTIAFGNHEGEIFHPATLERLASGTNALGISHAAGIALLLFAGTVGKSAQFPLHVWLPDAMEGPTPVSALIHAATMVAAGVFLVARTYPLFAADALSLQVVTVIGAFTALFAATMAVAQFDIKRILAYSTLSQLGFMVAALGIGGWVAGMFHLITHAFFKALLFLGSGALIHAMEAQPAIVKLHHRDEYAAQQTAQDIRNMGGLRTRLPWTFWTYTTGYLALAGIAPFAGFWSKDEILLDAFKYNLPVYVVLSLAAFLTAFYMTRQWLLVFFGPYRGAEPVEAVVAAAHTAHDSHAAHDDHAAHEHWHEDRAMTAALVLLAAFALTAGALNLPFSMPGGHWLADLWGQYAAGFNPLVAGISLLVAAAGIAAGWYIYRSSFARAADRDPLERRAPALFALLAARYRIDEFYAATIGRLTTALAQAWAWLDQHVIHAVVNGIGLTTLGIGRVNFIVDDTVLNDGPDALADGTLAVGRRTRRLQTGKAQDYLIYVFAGALALAMLYLYVIGR